MDTASYRQTQGSEWSFARVVRNLDHARTLGAASLLVGSVALGVWLFAGVRIGEIARFVGYEIGFVFLPGWLVYRALVARRGDRLREIVLGWSLGYVLEILAFFVTAESGVRSTFYDYPLVVGIPAALVAWKRRTESRAPSPSRRLPARLIWIGAGLCALLLLYAAAVGFTQTPLPRDISSVTYQEDTVFVISLAADALHHWPMQLPMVSGEPLHYHLFAFMDMAAVSQVTGIDLSVVVMRLYEVPLLLLFALQLVLVGRRVGRSTAAGLLALFAVLFLGELDPFGGAGVGRFVFRDLFFYWLLASHTFLLGLVFFLPTVLLLCDLLPPDRAHRRSRVAKWVLLVAFLVGCVGSKSYSLLAVLGALVVFMIWQLWRRRAVSRPALYALGLAGGVYVLANTFVLSWNSGGAFIRPWNNIERMAGVERLSTYFGHVWGTSNVPAIVQVPFGIFGLLGITILGLALLFRYRRLELSEAEVFLFSLFVAVLPTLFLSSQPGYGQMFLVFFGVVPGTVLATVGYSLFWRRNARFALGPAGATLAAGAALVLVLDLLLGASPLVGMQLTLFSLVAAGGLAAVAGAWSRRLVLPVGVGAAILGLLLVDTPVIRLVRSLGGASSQFHLGTAAGAAALVVALGVLAAALTYFSGRRSAGRALAVAVAGGTIFLGMLNTPLDWFPYLLERATAGKPVYDQTYSGLTSGLYHGLRWIRDNTPANAVLVVNNHSVHPDGRDSKYFYYSAFAERRVVLESWDYTEQTTRQGYFSLPAARTPFPQRLALSNAVFRDGNEQALRTLARRYGASYLVADKVHGSVSPSFEHLVPRVYADHDIDVYAIGRPGHWLCHSDQRAGIAAVFGHRRSPAAAADLRKLAGRVGFTGLEIQRRGCFDYAVVLTGLVDVAQAKALRSEAATVAFNVRLECRTFPPAGGLNAVFGHRRTKAAAERLAADADSLGFHGVMVQQDACGDWEVDRSGLRTAAERRTYLLDAEAVGLRVTFEPG